MHYKSVPSHTPHRKDILSMKREAGATEALNMVESQAHMFEGRQSTATERERALGVGAKMGNGTLPPFSLSPDKVLDNFQAPSGTTRSKQPSAADSAAIKRFFTP